MENKEIIEGILYLLLGTSPTWDGMGYTLEEIESFLKLNNIKEFEGDALKNFLHEMENENLIEERHFDLSGKDLGRIDYSIENSGIELINKIRKELKSEGIKIEDKWKLE